MAIKKMKKKFFSWEECMQLREVKVRRRVHINFLLPLGNVGSLFLVCLFVCLFSCCAVSPLVSPAIPLISLN
jgi:hypothetical protein